MVRREGSRVVCTVEGAVQGRRVAVKDGRFVDAFQGIPFAAPPIGPLRFQRPQPVERWSGVRKTARFGRRPVQKNVPFQYLQGATSENCLYLNVFTPTWTPPAEGFPVIVFIHGGAFIMDSCSTYGAKGMCKHLCTKDVVVVTVEYRVGYLGFWTTNDNACPSNVGLWDLTEGLLWVQRNIMAFDGDRTNVTVLGQSAGGVCAGLLHLSPHSTNLFHKLICMGGTAQAGWAFNNKMVQRCEEKAKKLGVTWTSGAEMVQKLREIPAKKFAGNIFTRRMKEGDEEDLEVTPHMDGDFFPSSLQQLWSSATPKPIVTGVTSDEGMLYTVVHRKDFSAESSRRLIHAHILPRSHPSFDSFLWNYLERINSKYPKQSPEVERFRNFNTIIADLHMNMPTVKFVDEALRVQPSLPLFNYVFDYHNPKCWGPLRWWLPYTGATHCCELAYLFGKNISFRFRFSREDKAVLHAFTRFMTNFAACGDVNGEGGQMQWRPCTRERPRQTLWIRVNSVMEEDYFGGRPEQCIEMMQKSLSSCT